MNLLEWTVDYGQGEVPIKLPHAWHTEVSVTWEGPAIYRTEVEVSEPDQWMVFHGVSYEAKIFFNDHLVETHLGMWDSFAVSLNGYEGQTVDVRVEVIKNGGPTYPVRDVLSGFLPYVFQTFGGIYREVDIVTSTKDPTAPSKRPPEPRIRVQDTNLYLDNVPIMLRGLLHWGWYPEIGHPNPDDETIRDEVRKAKALGFNMVKFCLWIPSHRYLEILDEERMLAWIEMPLWDPDGDPEKLTGMSGEMQRIALQYRHHRNIVAWTVGCELHETTPAHYRQDLVQRVKDITNCPLVKDNSGGSEMYGGDLREFGDFYDFHPYCDLQYYPPVLLSLLPGPRKNLPVMLGEFNDFDTYRDIHEMYKSLPFWAADSEHLNARGVRWQYDLPRLKNHRLAQPEAQEENARLRQASIDKGAYVRRKVMESVRSHGEIAGYAITGWRDTPISTAGLFDDEMNQVFKTEDIHTWNQPNMLFLIPTRRPPWQRGGNRPGYLDPQCYFAGQIYVKVGVSSERGEFGALHWKIEGVSEEFGSPLEVEPLDPLEVGVVSCDIEKPGAYTLNAEFGSVSASWPIWVVERPRWEKYKNWRNMSRAKHLTLPGGDNIVSHFLWPEVVETLKKGNNAVLYMDRDGTKVMPFWRECVVDIKGDLLKDFDGHWERLYSVAPDCALDEEWLEKHFDEYEVVMNRIDTRTYQEHPIAVRARLGKGWANITTLRPRGKLGSQPQSFSFNPAGAHLLKTLIEGF